MMPPGVITNVIIITNIIIVIIIFKSKKEFFVNQVNNTSNLHLNYKTILK